MEEAVYIKVSNNPALPRILLTNTSPMVMTSILTISHRVLTEGREKR